VSSFALSAIELAASFVFSFASCPNCLMSSMPAPTVSLALSAVPSAYLLVLEEV